VRLLEEMERIRTFNKAKKSIFSGEQLEKINSVLKKYGLRFTQDRLGEILGQVDTSSSAVLLGFNLANRSFYPMHTGKIVPFDRYKKEVERVIKILSELQSVAPFAVV